MARIVSIIISLIVGCVIHKVFSQEIITLDNSKIKHCYSEEIITSSPTEYKVRIKLHNFVSFKEEKEGRVFSRILLDNGITTQNLGEPSLPLVIQHIGIPPKSTYDIVLTEHKWIKKSTGLLYPVQNPFITKEENTNFILTDSIYKSSLYNYPLLDISNIYHWKNIDNIYIKICPFRYHPSENLLLVLSDFTLTIKFRNDNIESTDYPILSDKEKGYFDNPNFLPMNNEDSKFKSTNDSCSYLIIVGNMTDIENSQAMRDFRRWKALKGFKTKLVSTTTIGSDSASIKDYISQQQQIGIKYVLFVGDHQKIPLPSFLPNHVQIKNEILKSDYWYGCTNNSNQAELPIGRFLTNSLESFTNMVNKTINYESLFHEWSSRVLLVSHNDTYLFQNALETIRNNTYLQPMFFQRAYAADISYGGTNSNKYDVIDSINNGINIVTVNCHGNSGCFWMFNGDGSTISYDDRYLLANDTYPVILNGACLNGDFTDLNYSIARFFSCSDHCSTVFIGGTMPVYTHPFNAFLGYFYANLLNNQYYNLGQLILKSHMDNWGFDNPELAIDNAYNFICAGDPTLELWTGIQSRFDKFGIKTMEDSLLVYTTCVDSFKINRVSEDGQLLDNKYSEQTYLKIPIHFDNCDISINKHNYVPFVIHIDVDNNFLQNDSLSTNVYFTNTPFFIGYDVNIAQTNGNVVLEPGAKVMVNRGNGVIIKNGFECKLGAEFTIE